MRIFPDQELGLRALTVRPPWGDQIASGAKIIEYRSWGTDYRGDMIVTCACYALCVVRLRDCVDAGDEWHWLLADPRRLAKPMRLRGQLGLWRVRDPGSLGITI